MEENNQIEFNSMLSILERLSRITYDINSARARRDIPAFTGHLVDYYKEISSDLTDKEKVVHKLKGDEMKEFVLSVSNPLRVVIEATTSEEAEEIFNKKVEEDYDFPFNEAEDYDGWMVDDVMER